MAEIESGVYVSRTDPEEWEPDDEVGGDAHMLFDQGRSKAGLWRAVPEDLRGPVEVQIPARETILVLEGSVRIGVDRKIELELGAGDMTSVPEGALISWDPGPDCKVFWIYS